MTRFHTLHDGTKIPILTKAQRKAQAIVRFFDNMQRLGIGAADAEALLRLEKRLHRWHELECGVENGGVERDETTGKVSWYNSHTGKRSPYPDRETPALKRLAAIMAKFPDVAAYVQSDPRGCALYVYRKSDLEGRGEIMTCYSSIGVAVGVWS